ncbi:MAG: ATP-binding protein, partial [Myxococcota bacterium]
MSIFGLVGCALLTAAAVAAGPPGPPWRTDVWTMREGLPQDSVTDVLESRDGYVWLTTFGGIARFDGQAFETFTPARTEGLGHTRFVAIAESADGALWFATEDRGVYRFADGVMELVDAERRVVHLDSDAEGRVWGAALDHFVRYEADGTHEVPVTGGTAHFLDRLPSGGLIGSGRTIPPVCLSGPCGTFPPLPRWKGADYQRWSQDRQGDFWVSAHDRLVHWRSDRWDTVRRGSGLALQAGFAVGWGPDVWVVDDGRIVASGVDRRDAPPTFDTPIRTGWVDSREGLWLGLDGGGLVHLVPQAGRLHSLDRTSVWSVAPHGDGVWSASCAGVQAFDTAPPTGWGEWSVFRCPRLWQGHDAGLLLFGARRDTIHLAILRYAPSGNPELVADLDPRHPDRFAAPNHGPWFVFRDRVYAVPPRGRAAPLVSAAELGARHVRVLHGPEDPGTPVRQRAVWLVLDRTRLVLWRASEVLRDITLEGTAPVRDLLEHGDRTWVSTYGSGLLAVRGDRVEGQVTAEHGLCDDSLSHLSRSDDGRLWLNTNQGVGFVEEAAVEAVLAGHQPRLRCVPVTPQEANGAAGWLAPDGRLWVPTTTGLAEVDTTRARVPEPPPLRLERADYRGHDLRAAPRVQGPGILSLRFVALDFVRPLDVQYRYRLDGPTSSGPDWSPPSRSRELHLGPLDPGQYRFEVQALAPGASWTAPEELVFVRRPDLGETIWVRTVLPLTLLGALIVGLVGGWQRDRRARLALQVQILERERAEKRANREQKRHARAQAELEASRRLQSLGRLAGGVAHDFNNLLVVVASHAALLREHADAAVRESAGELGELVQRATELVRQLLVVGQREAHAPVLVELGTALEQLMPLLQRMIRDNVVVTLNREARCWVNVDPSRLDRVITELVLNGAEAIADDGRIGLTVRVGEGPDGPRAEILVEDTGSGMTAEQLEHAFEPYYSTKTASQGTGLGLATVHGAVKEAGGNLTLALRGTQGTC